MVRYALVVFFDGNKEVEIDTHKQDISAKDVNAIIKKEFRGVRRKKLFYLADCEAIVVGTVNWGVLPDEERCAKISKTFKKRIG